MFLKIAKYILVVLIFGRLSFTGEAAPSCTAYRTQGKITIDGKLDESDWKGKITNGHFSSIYADYADPVETFFGVLHDDEALYFGVQCQEPYMDKIRTVVTQQDADCTSDDSIELFLSPPRTGQDAFNLTYYQFAVNLADVYYDAKCGRSDADPSWRGDIEIGTNKEKDGWTMEIKIPFYTFNIPYDDSSSWLFNIGRNRPAKHTEQRQTYTYSPMKGYFAQPALFAKLGGVNVDFHKYSFRILSTWITKLEAAPEGFKTMVAGFLVENETGENVTTKIEGALCLPDGKIIKANALDMLPKGKSINNSLKWVLPDVYFKSGENKSRLTITLLKNLTDTTDTIVYRDTLPLSLFYEPLKISIEKPFYRKAIYLDKDGQSAVKDIELKITSPLDPEKLKGRKISIKFLSPEKKIISEKIVIIKETGNALDETVSLMMPVLLLPGDYMCTAEFLDLDKKEAAEKAFDVFHVYPFKNYGVTIDENLNLLIGHKPILVSGWWGGLPGAASMIKEMNCTATVNGFIPKEVEKIKDFLDAFDKQGLKAIISPYPDESYNQKRGESSKKPLSNEQKEKLVDRVNKLKDHAAILAWYLVDEPEGGAGIAPSRIEEINNILREADPYHPTFLNTSGAATAYHNGADIISQDPYLNFRRDGGCISPPTLISDRIQDTARAVENKKPVFIVPQAFSHGAYLYDNVRGISDYRAPTYDEARLEGWLSFIYGVNGIFYYTWDEHFSSPSLRIGMPYIFKEIAALENIILTPGSLPRKIDAGKNLSSYQAATIIHCIVKKYNNHIYIFAANTANLKIEAAITIPALKENLVKVISEQRKINIEDTILRDTFPPYGVHLYTTDMEFKETVTVVEARTKIQEEINRLMNSGNIAYADKGVRVRASSFHHMRSPGKVIDGETTYGKGWYPKDVTFKWKKEKYEWVEIEFPKEYKIGRVEVYNYNCYSPDLRIKDYQLQAWDGAKYITKDEVKNNNKEVITHDLNGLRTNKIRILVTDANVGAWITEVSVYEFNR